MKFISFLNNKVEGAEGPLDLAVINIWRMKMLKAPFSWRFFVAGKVRERLVPDVMTFTTTLKRTRRVRGIIVRGKLPGSPWHAFVRFYKLSGVYPLPN